jgi:hypothetical protein
VDGIIRRGERTSKNYRGGIVSYEKGYKFTEENLFTTERNILILGGTRKMSEDYDPKEYCQIAFSEVSGLCSNPEDAFRQIAMFMGFNPMNINEMFPIGERYKEVLENDLGDAECSSINAVHNWVLARAWQLHSEDGEEVLDAIRIAWQEARERCSDSGMWI